VIDLEGLANHRGSLFGRMPGGQPSQKLFDSRLAAVIDNLDLARPVVVEAESSRVGTITLPKQIWAAMQAAPVIELTAEMGDRIARISREYDGFSRNPEAVREVLERLPRHISKAQRAEWLELAETGQTDAFIQSLIEGHYDPAYGRSTRSSAIVRAGYLDGVLAALSRIGTVPR